MAIFVHLMAAKREMSQDSTKPFSRANEMCLHKTGFPFRLTAGATVTPRNFNKEETLPA